MIVSRIIADRTGHDLIDRRSHDSRSVRPTRPYNDHQDEYIYDHHHDDHDIYYGDHNEYYYGDHNEYYYSYSPGYWWPTYSTGLWWWYDTGLYAGPMCYSVSYGYGPSYEWGYSAGFGDYSYYGVRYPYYPWSSYFGWSAFRDYWRPWYDVHVGSIDWWSGVPVYYYGEYDYDYWTCYPRYVHSGFSILVGLFHPASYLQLGLFF